MSELAKDPRNEHVIAALQREREALAAFADVDVPVQDAETTRARLAEVDAELKERGHKPRAAGASAPAEGDPHRQPPKGRRASPKSEG